MALQTLPISTENNQNNLTIHSEQTKQKGTKMANESETGSLDDLIDAIKGLKDIPESARKDCLEDLYRWTKLSMVLFQV